MAERYQKLVRDLIPEHIKANGELPQVRKLSLKEFKIELLKKLTEEVEEVSRAESRQERIAELADVQEVLLALYAAYGIEGQEVTKVGRQKRKDKGAFTKRLYLESVT